MNLKHAFPKTLMAGALLAASVASQAYVITIAPTGSPLGCTTANSDASVDCRTFQTDSVVGSLGSRLTISNYQDPTLAGPYGATYLEVGQIAIDDFKLASASVKSTIASLGFEVWAEFELSGAGVWSQNLTGDTIFTALTGSLSNSALYASFGTGGTAVKIADLTLLPGNLSAIANATLASTSLSASFEILPVAGSTGPGGFFEMPAVWNVDLFANNVGFGQGTGAVTPAPLVDGQQAFFTTNLFDTTPVREGGSGSFNGAFVERIPEPATLGLVGLALACVGFASRKRKIQA